MEFVSVFDEAGRDHEAEARESRLTAASVEAQQVWPFLALAQSTEEFSHRLALREDRLSAIAARHGVSFEDVAGPFTRAFEAIHVEAAGLECRRCNHSNGPHTQGAACTCGCTTFQPKVTASVTAGRDEWEHDCTECGKTTTSTRENQDCSCGNKADNLYTTYKGKTSSDKDHGPRGPYNDEPYREASRKTAAEHGPSYNRDCVKDLPLNGATTNPERFYDEGYEHGRSGQEHRGYGGRDKAIAYGTGYNHGKADASTYTAAKTAAGNPDCLTGYGKDDPSKCACASCLRHPDSGMSEADKNYHRQVNDIADRNNPDSPEYNDFDPAQHRQDMYGEGFKTHNVNGHTVHEFASTTQGYNHSQTSDKIKDGDVLSVPSEGVHGFMYQAWPVASTEAHGEFHKADMEGLLGDSPQYARAHEVAQSLAHIQPKDAAWRGHLAALHQALMDGQDPLQWIVEQNPPGGPQYALVPSHHDSEQKFVADGTTGGAPDALDQALEQAGTSAPPSEHHEKQGSRPF